MSEAERPAAGGGEPERADAPVLEVPAELDVPGETRRQARIFLAWLVCLLLAVVASSIAGAHVPLEKEGSLWAEEQLSAARARRVKIALVVGLLVPAGLTLLIDVRYRRGGAHARGIVVDVTEGGELRIWGRGYGTRVALEHAEVNERLVDVYAGRLGAWRQRRLRVRGSAAGRASSPAGAREIELATTAVEADAAEGLRVDGGEGDCVELGREDFERVRAAVLERARRAS